MTQQLHRSRSYFENTTSPSWQSPVLEHKSLNLHITHSAADDQLQQIQTRLAKYILSYHKNVDKNWYFLMMYPLLIQSMTEQLGYVSPFTVLVIEEEKTINATFITTTMYCYSTNKLSTCS